MNTKNYLNLLIVLLFACTGKNVNEESNNSKMNDNFNKSNPNEVCNALEYSSKNNILSYFYSINKSFLYDITGRYVEVKSDTGENEVVSLDSDTKESRSKLITYENINAGYITIAPLDLESTSNFVLFKGNDKDVLAVSRCDYGPACEQTLTFIEFSKEGCLIVTDEIFIKPSNDLIQQKLLEMKENKAIKIIPDDLGEYEIPTIIVLPEHGTNLKLIIDPEFINDEIILFSYKWNKDRFVLM